MWSAVADFPGVHFSCSRKRDNPNAIVQFLDTGHFGLEKHPDEIAAAMHEFLGRAVLMGLRLMAASDAYTALRQLRGKVKFSMTWQQLKDDR